MGKEVKNGEEREHERQVRSGGNDSKEREDEFDRWKERGGKRDRGRVNRRSDLKSKGG